MGVEYHTLLRGLMVTPNDSCLSRLKVYCEGPRMQKLFGHSSGVFGLPNCTQILGNKSGLVARKACNLIPLLLLWWRDLIIQITKLIIFNGKQHIYPFWDISHLIFGFVINFSYIFVVLFFSLEKPTFSLEYITSLSPSY